MTKTANTLAGFLALASIASTAATLAVVSSFKKEAKMKLLMNIKILVIHLISTLTHCCQIHLKIMLLENSCKV